MRWRLPACSGAGELMARYYSAAELAMLLRRPVGTIRRLASVDKWRRTADDRRPVLYDMDDVEATMARLARCVDDVT